MGTRDPRVDAYIARARDFARPVLEHLRKVVHEGCPDVVETIKWGMPSFEHHGLIAGMAAFKEHCAFSFWKQALVVPDEARRAKEGMGAFGRVRSVADLPPRAALLRYVRAAARLNEEGVKAPRAKSARPRAVRVPAALKAALAKNARARAAFEGMPPSHRREYAEWIAEAKKEETRDRRVATAIEWLAEGKSLRWKYERA